jgi:hypothetical protein
VNLIKYALLIVCLIVSSCSRGGTDKAIENQVLTDERFFSKPVRFPSGKVTNEQRESFAKELESAIDGTKANFEVITIRAEAPNKDIIALYARGMTRQECESLLQSEIIQRATTIGFRRISCEDRANRVAISIPIKGSQGEVRIVTDSQGEIQVQPVR